VLLELSPKEQESMSWQVLNSCKLLYSLAQPLIWLDCGKYVIESLVFAFLCMESVISLCSARHVNMRLKLLASAFAAALSSPGGKIEEATKILDLAAKTVSELREREEQDMPIPIKNEAPLVCAEADVGVMRCVLSFWSNPDTFDVSDSALAKFNFPDWGLLEKCEKFVSRKAPSQDFWHEGSMGEGGDPGPMGLLAETGKPIWVVKSIQDRCVCECVRVQQLSAGNMNEVWKKRSTGLLKGFWTFFDKRNDVYFSDPSSSSSSSSSAAAATTEGEGSEGDEQEMAMSTHTPSLPVYTATPPVLSLSCLAEIAAIAAFETTDFPHTLALLEKLWAIVGTFPIATAPRQHIYAGSSKSLLLHPSIHPSLPPSTPPFISEALLPYGSEDLVILGR